MGNEHGQVVGDEVEFRHDPFALRDFFSKLSVEAAQFLVAFRAPVRVRDDFQFRARHGGDRGQDLEMLLAEVRPPGILAVDHARDLVIDNQRHAYLGKRRLHVWNVAAVLGQIVDDDRLLVLRHPAGNALAYGDFQGVYDLVAVGILGPDSGDLTQQVPVPVH